ncbi:MAG: isoleucine--tRNA ligase [Bacteroidia bacterium]|nr:MAG: isoleucine--tRNA ligase [Bacteroidia bacterium]
MEYKDTVNLYETSFPMRGDLAKREPLMLEKWYQERRYQKLRQLCVGRPKFILHDGPPYANGELHVGHASNKILKDIIIRSKTLANFDAPYIPGWDCHGLPIELNVEKMIGKKLANKSFRDACRKYAEEQITQQKKDFMRLGILGDWDHPYKTMNYATESGIVRALGDAYKNGYLQSGVKPVHWCTDCGSALAEAEVEYQNKVSPSIYVKFRLSQNDSEVSKKSRAIIKDAFGDAVFSKDSISKDGTFKNGTSKDETFLANLYAVIWTTTPWTLPANEAVSVNPELQYSLIKLDGEYLILAHDLVEKVLAHDQFATFTYELMATTSGAKLEHVWLQHPFLAKEVPIILGAHVSLEAGTGLVHTAPAHGLEDYLVGLEYKLPLECLVNNEGNFIKSMPFVGGLSVWEANPQIITILEQNGHLLAGFKLEHSYPHCWRHKTPIIFRSTAQWFISMDKKGSDGVTLREKAMQGVDATTFFPSYGRARLESMVKNRPDWCISRQRCWGVPMPFFVHRDTGQLHPDSYQILQRVAALIAMGGIDAWFDESLTASSLQISDADNYIKLKDTIDVWFDSGTTHLTVLAHNPDLKWPADLYLEGSDQHRGWFQSSLLTACAIKGEPPYRQLLTHGFLVDGNGYKMSKSKGNIVSIPKGVNKYGADILRLWVASVDYSDDIAFSDEILKRVTDTYRRIRNTIRFLLANLVDFDFSKDAIPVDDLMEVDKYALILLAKLQTKVVGELYPKYQFHTLVQELVQFCSEDLGGFYLDILKDRLYTSKVNGKVRRSAQTTLYYLVNALLLMLSPILAFTADEAWEVLHNDPSDSTLYHNFYEIPTIQESEAIYAKWTKICKLRELVLHELEAKRADNTIGSSLQAKLEIALTANDYLLLQDMASELKFAYMVSELNLVSFDANNNTVLVHKSEDQKCERCWHYSDSVGEIKEHPTICTRCVDNLFGDGEQRKFV